MVVVRQPASLPALMLESRSKSHNRSHGETAPLCRRGCREPLDMLFLIIVFPLLFNLILLSSSPFFSLSVLLHFLHVVFFVCSFYGYVFFEDLRS